MDRDESAAWAALLFVIGLGVFCLVLRFVYKYFYFADQYFFFGDDDSLARWLGQRPTLPPAPRPAVDGLDLVIVRSLPLVPCDGKEPLDCVVCVNEIQKNESVRIILTCGHVFHPECIDIWLVTSACCPLCRSIQMHADVVVTRGSEEGPSTVAREDALIEGDGKEESSSSMRRTSSCSSLKGKV